VNCSTPGYAAPGGERPSLGRLERLFYRHFVRQLSFYSADAHPPRVADLAGLLCGPGQAVRFGHSGAARLSVVVVDRWRVLALQDVCAERGVQAEVATSAEGNPLLRTAFRTDLSGLTAEWTRGAVKAVPDGLELTGPILRVWVITCGVRDSSGYLLGLDPHAEDTHEPLAVALARAGLAAVLVGARGAHPAMRLTGRRRLARLLELVGDPPPGTPADTWPK